MKKKSKLFTFFVAAALITMACSCPLTGLIDQFTNPQPEDLLELVPDELMEELPENLDEIIEEVVTAVPDEIIENLETLPEALQEGDMEDLFNTGIPENLPMVEDYDNLLSFGGVISFSTSNSVTDMAAFYDTQMPNYGWVKDENSSYIDAENQNSAGNFTNDTQMATISIVQSEGQTLVTIIISDK